MWNKDRKDKLILMWRIGIDEEEIAKEVDKPVGAVLTMASRLKLGRRKQPGRKHGPTVSPDIRSDLGDDYNLYDNPETID